MPSIALPVPPTQFPDVVVVILLLAEEPFDLRVHSRVLVAHLFAFGIDSVLSSWIGESSHQHRTRALTVISLALYCPFFYNHTAMERLLEAAAEIAAMAPNGHVPHMDLPIPDEYKTVPTDELLEIRPTRTKGRGFFAKTEIAPGTMLLVAKPVALAMDWEDDTIEVDVPEDEEMADEDGEGGDEDEPRLNEVLLIRLLEKLRDDPGLWERSLSMLFPRDATDLASLPAWVPREDDVFEKVEQSVQELQKLPDMEETAKEISRRLPHIIR